MEKVFDEKVIVITGGGDGIGLSIAENYLKHGAKLTILLDINEKKGTKAAENLSSKYGDGKAIFMKCDVTKDLDEVFKKITNEQKIDVLVNNAGTASSVDKDMIAVNLTAVIEWSSKFLEAARKDKGGEGGTIINISSIFGYRITAIKSTYNACKFGVTAFSRSLGHEDNYSKTGVRVVAVCPGFTETSLTAPLLQPGCDEQLNEVVRSHEWQSVDAVGKGAVEIFQKAKSGSVWVIEGGKVEELGLNG